MFDEEERSNGTSSSIGDGFDSNMSGGELCELGELGSSIVVEHN